MFQKLAMIGFTLWGIYKGYWVCRKVYKWLRFKYQCWEAEENFVNGLAAQIRAEREADLASTRNN